MADDDFSIPSWFPRFWERPRTTPRIVDQLKCPAGQHREIGRGCVPDTPPPPPVLVQLPTAPPSPSTRDTSRDRPPKLDEARGPLPPVIVTPPVTPPPVVPSTPPPGSVVDATTGRYYPRVRTVRLPNLFEAASRAGLVLWVLGTLV